MTTPLEKFLNAHGAMRKFGTRYRGPCRACGASDKSACLGVMEADNGTLLVKCFRNECSIEAIAGSVDLDVTDLFPERADAHQSHRPKRKSLLSPRDAIELIEFETTLVATSAFNLANGHKLTPDDLRRLSVAARRIMAAVSEARK